MPVMTPDDQKYLRLAFADLMNLLSDNPLDPVDPVTYREPSGDTCLHIAAIRGDLRAAQLLLAAGLDVNSLGDMGNTPLHYANSFNHLNIEQLLIKRGADTSLVNEFGETAISRNT
jgi:ankyrin repeat protein